MLKRLYGNVQKLWSIPIKNRHVRTALPFFIFMALGLAVITECSSVRYLFRNRRTLDRDDLQRLGLKLPEVYQPLEELYEEYRKKDIDNWENVRGPRLWDETPSN